MTSVFQPRSFFNTAVLSSLLGCIGGVGLAQAQSLGEIEYTRGAAAAQREGQAQRLVGAGAKIEQGETITTATGSFAIIKLNDGTKMTLRPNTALRIDELVANQPDKTDSGIFNLLRGGLRVVTGLVSKRNPNAARVITPTATVGIRGTDFDVRICGTDCANEERRLAQAGRKPEPAAPQASARLAISTTAVSAVQADGQRRAVVQGGPVYPGDLLETGGQGHAILVFRDETRLTVQSGTRFKVEDYVYDAKNPAQGVVAFSLLKGAIRAFTGVIGKARPAAVRVSTPTATVGIRGTGFDLVCEGKCAGEAPPWPVSKAPDCMLVSTWQGETEVRNTDAEPGSGMPVAVGQTACQETPTSAPRIIGQPDFMRDNTAPRPDQVVVDGGFGQTDIAVADPGVYVLVRDGHVTAGSGSSAVDIGRGESLFVGGNGTVITRPSLIPGFLDNDPTPRPDQPLRPATGGDTGLVVRPVLVCRR